MAEIWVPAECRHSQPHGRRPSLLHTPAKHEVLIANVHRVRACRQSARSCTPLAEGRGPVEPWGPVQPSLPLHWGGGEGITPLRFSVVFHRGWYPRLRPLQFCT